MKVNNFLAKNGDGSGWIICFTPYLG